MILLSEYLNELVTGEGNQTAHVVTKDGKFNAAKINNIITILNAALADIYKRFYVQNLELVFETKAGKTDYDLVYENSTGSGNPDAFLVSDQPFHVTAITGLRTYHEGYPIALNKQSSYEHYPNGYIYEHNADNIPAHHIRHGIYTPDYNTIRFPSNMAVTTFIVSVKTTHPKIESIDEADIESFDYDSVVIHLPRTYLSALCFYTISRLLNSKGAETIGRTIFHEGDNYMKRYLTECESLKQTDSEVTPVPDMMNSLRVKGFI